MSEQLFQFIADNRTEYSVLVTGVSEENAREKLRVWLDDKPNLNCYRWRMTFICAKLGDGIFQLGMQY